MSDSIAEARSEEEINYKYFISDDSISQTRSLDDDDFYSSKPILRQDSIPPFSAPPEKKSSVFGTSCNLLNNIIGGIGMPYAIAQCGLIAGPLLYIVVAVLTDKSLRMLIDSSVFHRKFYGKKVETFEDLMYYPFGSIGRGFILLSMFLISYGAMVGYLIIIKDTVPTIIGFDEGIQRELVMIVTTLFIIVPISMQRDIASLESASIVSIFCEFSVLVYVVSYSPVMMSIMEHGGLWEILKRNAICPNLFVGLGIFSDVLCCQHGGFMIYGSLRQNNRKRWSQVTCYSISTATILSLSLGIIGFIGFLDDIQADSLNNFPGGSVQANIARTLLAITMFFSYPMESFVGRHVIVDLIHKGNMDGISKKHFLYREFFNRRKRMTILLYITCLIPAIILDDLGPILSVSGCIGGSMMSFIAPGIAYIGVNAQEFLAWAISLLPNQTIQIQPLDNTITLQLSTPNHPSIPKQRKPLWWYICLFPLWCHIAKAACLGMESRLDVETYKPDPSDPDTAPEPTGRDFIIAIFFIIFGCVALVAGLISNVIVQI